MRAAALNALAKTDVDTFISSISGLDPDAHWSVRAALATTLGDLGRERAQAPLTAMLNDSDQRVIPAVLDALAKIGATNAAEALTARLKADDPVVRGAAARGLATIKAAECHRRAHRSLQDGTARRAVRRAHQRPRRADRARSRGGTAAG